MDENNGVPYGTKYPAEGAPVTKFGGNEAIHDGVETNASPSSLMRADKPQDEAAA